MDDDDDMLVDDAELNSLSNERRAVGCSGDGNECEKDCHCE